ncbi:MAG: T9SS type A sorting domain-containing protein [Flavobacteriales bacterium]|nr:T9SS type A sorting domain-containing protein [Flavobacteriales bacterium]
MKPGVTHHSVDMRDLSTGLYILRVELGGKLHVKRVIKQ